MLAGELDKTAFRSLPDIIRDRIQAWPGRVALRHLGESYRYEEVAAAADAVSRELLLRGIQVGEHVACCVQRGPAELAAMLGVMQIGAVLLPVDPGHPAARLADIAARADARYAVADPGDADVIAGMGIESANCVLLAGLSVENPASGGGSFESAPVSAHLSKDAPAYTLFTSGSTGKPKGVTIPHGALCCSVVDGVNAIGMEEGDRCGQLASLTFDASVWEHLAPLYVGGTLVTVPPSAMGSPDGLMRLISEERISWTYLPPALFATWIAYIEQAGPSQPKQWLASLRRILFAGDVLSPALVRRWQGWFGVRPTLMNFYGPTETTVLVCGSIIDKPLDEQTATIPIGKPFGHNRVEILDEQLQPCRPGETGTLFIGGPQLALGYLNEPELTDLSFVPDPQNPHERLYDSRDLGFYDGNGDVVFAGRRDRQVKVRGKRIELGEIETHLQRLPGIRDAAAVVHEEDDFKLIIAFVTGDRLYGADVRRGLSASLPDYMVPHEILVRDSLPLNVNGKVDRNALAEEFKASRQNSADTDIAGEDPVAAIWRTTLKTLPERDDISFFDAGGDSLLLLRALTLAREYGFALPSHAELSADNTLKGWRSMLRPAGDDTVPRAVCSDKYALGPMEREMFRQIEARPSTHLYNIQFVFEAAALDADRLEQAFQEVIRVHPILRTVFPGSGEDREHRVLPPATAASFRLERVTLAGGPGDDLEAWKVRDHVRDFDPELFPLFRAAWIEDGSRHYLGLTFFHPLLDGWSFSHLVLQTCEVYRRLQNGQPLYLPTPSGSFADYVAWCEHQAGSEQAVSERTFWQQRLRAPLPLVPLPGDGHGGLLERCAFWQELDAPTSDALKALAGELGTTLHRVLLAAYFRLFNRLSGQSELLIGNTVCGRPPQVPDVDRILGCFISIVPVRIADTAVSFPELVRAVATELDEVDRNQAVPNENHVSALLPEEKRRGMHWRVIFALDNFPETYDVPELRWPPLSWNPIEPFEIALSVIDLNGRLYCYWNYRADRVSEHSARRIGEEYLSTLRQVVERPDASRRRVLMGLGAASLLPLTPIPGKAEAQAKVSVGVGGKSGKQTITNLLEDYRCRCDIPGFAAAVIYDGQVVKTVGLGHAQLDPPVPVTENTLFHFYSITKVVTATAVVQLVERGKMSFEDDIREYLPDAPIHHRFDTEPRVTIEHLLSHQSGYKREMAGPPLRLRGDEPADNPRALLYAMLEEERLHYQPGTDSTYSNLNYGLLAAAVESATGEPYGNYLEREVLRPLGMTATGPAYAAGPGNTEAAGYMGNWSMMSWMLRFFYSSDLRERLLTGNGLFGDRVLAPFEFEIPGFGELIGPVDDLGRFVEFHTAGSSPRFDAILSPASRARMRAHNGARFGLAWMHGEVNGMHAVSHTGGGPGFSSYIGVVPEQRFGVAFLSNRFVGQRPPVGELLRACIEETKIS